MGTLLFSNWPQHCFLRIVCGLLKDPSPNVRMFIYVFTKQALLIVYKDVYT